MSLQEESNANITFEDSVELTTRLARGVTDALLDRSEAGALAASQGVLLADSWDSSRRFANRM